MGYPDNEENLSNAVNSAVMESDLAGFESGFETMIGSKGVKLSGGQVQRVAAARMFTRETDIVVFDDMSSALDISTENKLWNRIFEIKDKTCLVVSHRKAALLRADKIIVMKDGRIDDCGKLSDLLVRNQEMQAFWSSV